MDLKYGDLIDLVLCESDDPEDIIKHLYNWKYKIDFLLLQITIGLIVAMIVASYSDYQNIVENEFRLYFLILSIILLIVIVIYQYFRIMETKKLLIASVKNFYMLKRYIGV